MRGPPIELKTAQSSRHPLRLFNVQVAVTKHRASYFTELLLEGLEEKK